MTRRITWLVVLAWLVVGVAIWQTATLFPYLNLDLTRQYLALAAMAGLAELIAAPLPFGRLSTGFAVLLAAQLVFGPAAAVWIWALATLVGQGIANRGNPLRTTIFNAAQYTVAAVAAGQVWARAAPWVSLGFLSADAGQAVVFTGAYYLAGLVFLAVFYRGRPGTFSHLRDALEWDLFSYLVTLPFGLVLAVLYAGTGLAGAVLLFLPLLAVGFVLRGYVRTVLADRELTAWQGLAAHLATVQDPAKAFRLVLAAVAKLVPCHAAMLFLWSEADQCFRVQAFRGAGRLAEIRMFKEQALPARLAKERRPLLIRDTRLERSLTGEAGPAQLWRSLALFPLLAEEGVAGILVLGDKRTAAFSERHQATLAIPVALAGVLSTSVLLGRRLAEASATDALTGLYDRRYFLLRVAEEGERVKRFGTEFAVALLALDSLGPVGERFGRPSAESLLGEAAGLLSRTVRPVDLAARYGEGELAVLMPETGLKEAAWQVEQLVNAFSAYEFPLGEGTTVQMSLRTAWAVYPRQAQDVAGLLRRLEDKLAPEA